MDCSTPGLSVLHYFLEFAWTYIHCVGKAISLSLLISATPFFFCLQSFQASGSFLMSWFFASGGQSIGASALASVLPLNIQGWFPLGLTGLISLQSQGLSRVFSNTIVWKCQFFGAQPSLSLSLSIYLSIYNGCLGRWTEERYNVVSSVQMFSDPWIHFHFANVPGLYPGGAWVTAGK